MSAVIQRGFVTGHLDDVDNVHFHLSAEEIENNHVTVKAKGAYTPLRFNYLQDVNGKIIEMDSDYMRTRCWFELTPKEAVE